MPHHPIGGDRGQNLGILQKQLPTLRRHFPVEGQIGGSRQGHGHGGDYERKTALQVQGHQLPRACPEVLELLREPEDAEMFGGESWHSDITWLKPAGYASILHAVELPEVGGDTAFGSTIAAFESLSEGLKETLRGLTAFHAYHWYERREDPEWTAEHPVVRRTDDGREALYVTRMFTSRFNGMTVEESRPLLNYLFDHQERHEFTCRFRWRLGDVLIWDNRFCLHYPINDFALPHGHRARRRMIRTSSMEA